MESVLEQKYSNIEFIIIDNDSSDSTKSLIKGYEDKIDYFVSEKDKGIYDAMNKGVKISNGAWLYFLGADDILVNCLHKIVTRLKKNNHIYYGVVYLPNKNKVYGGKFYYHTLVSKNINHQSIFYPRSVFKKYEFDLQYPILADYALNMKLWADKNYRFRYISEGS